MTGAVCDLTSPTHWPPLGHRSQGALLGSRPALPARPALGRALQRSAMFLPAQIQVCCGGG